MPFVERPQFVLPEQDDAFIWRYMDLAKFMSILQWRTLYFPSFAQFDDPFEGAYPPAYREVIFGALRTLAGQDPQSLTHLDKSKETFDRDYYERARKFAFASCWHVSPVESGAMWKIYGKDSIAIRSTVGRLRDSVHAQGEWPVNIGMVRYEDYDDHTPREPFPATLVKRPMYDYEKELRAVIQLSDKTHPTPPPGVNVTVPTEVLIEKVYIGPDQSGWYVNLVRDLMHQAGLAGVEIERSRMDEDPILVR